jgi:hypothetical protein
MVFEVRPRRYKVAALQGGEWNMLADAKAYYTTCNI